MVCRCSLFCVVLILFPYFCNIFFHAVSNGVLIPQIVCMLDFSFYNVSSFCLAHYPLFKQAKYFSLIHVGIVRNMLEYGVFIIVQMFFPMTFFHFSFNILGFKLSKKPLMSNVTTSIGFSSVKFSFI